MNLLDYRRLRLHRMRHARQRNLDIFQRIVLARLAKSKDIAQIWSRFVPVREGLEVPPQLKSLQDRRVVDRATLCPKHGTLGDARRNQKGWNAYAESREIEPKLADGTVRWRRTPRRWN